MIPEKELEKMSKAEAYARLSGDLTLRQRNGLRLFLAEFYNGRHAFFYARKEFVSMYGLKSYSAPFIIGQN